MKRGFLFFTLLLFFSWLPQGAFAKNPNLNLSLVTATSIQDRLPFEIFTKGHWKPESDAKYVKLHLYFDTEFLLSKIELLSCGENFQEDIGAYINFDGYYGELPGGTALSSYQFNKPVPARSITFNFGMMHSPCIAGVRLFDPQNNLYQIKTPKIVEGTVKASNTLKPVRSYHVMNLFDSRYEYAWATDKKTKGVKLDFQFQKKQTITKLKIWNGYQRSTQHCFSNSRVKSILLEGDQGYRETIKIKDILGPQEIQLPKPFRGKKLRFTVQDVYKGKSYSDLVISELRFHNGEEWFLFNPQPHIQSNTKHFSNLFDKAGLREILNDSLAGEANNEDKKKETEQGIYENQQWKLRLRTDGSFFLEGETYRANSQKEEEVNQKFFALGNYDVRKAKNQSMQLRIFGNLRVYTEVLDMEMDCNGCGKDCNLQGNELASEGRIFQQILKIERHDGSSYRITNQSKKNKLNIKNVMMQIEEDES